MFIISFLSPFLIPLVRMMLEIQYTFLPYNLCQLFATVCTYVYYAAIMCIVANRAIS